MSISRKYGRTFHYDFSPGTTSDDRINRDWFEDMLKFNFSVIHTEKLDGENTCLNEIGIFARSHAAPTQHPWSNHLKEKYSVIKRDLKDFGIEIFGENVYAQHSIKYEKLDSHFYVFGIRQKDVWLSWEEVEYYSELLEYPTVPILKTEEIPDITKQEITDYIIKESAKPSVFGSYDLTKEGIVSRNIDEYPVNELSKNVFKYVRKDHVSTDVHWTRNWKRAPLIWEKK
jgi:hypothetical protein